MTAGGWPPLFCEGVKGRTPETIICLCSVGNEMDPSPLCHDEIAQHQTGIEERGSTYEQV